MTHRKFPAIPPTWVEVVRTSLEAKGYYYQPDFCFDTKDSCELVVEAARMLGDLYLPAGLDPSSPAILTNPSPAAPRWRPFDRSIAIGWHNDFATRSVRPALSLSCIRTADPAGGGAWRVASTDQIVASLSGDPAGRSFVASLAAHSEPFGYRDSNYWRSFRVVTRVRDTRRRGLRFYGRALEEGSLLRFGKVTSRTKEITERVQKAADTVGVELPATAGALLIVDNCFSLHDRTRQEVRGDASPRQAWLCFVKTPHFMTGPIAAKS